MPRRREWEAVVQETDEVLDSSDGEASEGLFDREDVPTSEAEARAQKKARVAQVLVRGLLNSKLQQIYDAAVPDGYMGKYVRDTPEDVFRYMNLGYGFKYKPKAKGLHASADDRIRVADVVLMTIRKEDWDVLKEVRLEEIKRKLGRGEEEFMNRLNQEVEEGGPVPFSEGETRIVS